MLNMNNSMKYYQYIYSSIFIVLIAINSNIYAKSKFSEIDSLNQDFQNLKLPAIPLEFSNLLKNIPDVDQSKTSKLQLIQQIVNKIQSTNACNKIKNQDLRLNVEIGLELLELLKRVQGKKINYQGSISKLPDANRWYRLLTLWWLGYDVKPSELREIGQQDFTQAYSEYIKTKSNIEPNKSKTIVHSKDVILQEYINTKVAVLKNMGPLFEKAVNIPPLKIKWSDLGDEFPAPGYYDLSSGTFFINFLKDYDNTAQIDWLFLHEGIPGHHYQYQLSQANDTCKFGNSYRPNIAFSEGWAAYVETLGKELGIYQESDRKLAALKWQSLRAFRVLVDVGIHHQGWTYQEAKKYWVNNFPDGVDVMEREIKRIQRWPMQVNTYVYGKHRIELLKKNLKEDDPNYNTKTYHHNILALSHMPLFSVDSYREFVDLLE